MKRRLSAIQNMPMPTDNLAMLLELDYPLWAIRHYEQYLKINPEDPENNRITQAIQRLKERITIK